MITVAAVGIFSEACTTAVNNSNFGSDVKAVYLSVISDEEGNPKSRALASFYPKGGLAAAASACGFSGFDWRQIVEFLPANFGAHKSAPPPFSDNKISGVYPFYYSVNGSDTELYSLTYNMRDKPSQCPRGYSQSSNGVGGDGVLCYTDEPLTPDTPPLYYAIEFTTSLVGIITGGDCKDPAGCPSEPLAQWIWMDSFNSVTTKRDGKYPGYVTILSKTDNIHLQ